jgi:hypothetical protein
MALGKPDSLSAGMRLVSLRPKPRLRLYKGPVDPILRYGEKTLHSYTAWQYMCTMLWHMLTS